jgi:hypothetical protein
MGGAGGWRRPLSSTWQSNALARLPHPRPSRSAALHDGVRRQLVASHLSRHASHFVSWPRQDFARFVSRASAGWQPECVSGRKQACMYDQDAPAAVAPAVVTLPVEIELDDASRPGAGPAYLALHEAVASGVSMVIADLTGTTFCDYPGFHQLAMIHRQAATGDVQLRLAMPADGVVRRWLEFLAQHRLVRAYPDLDAAKTAL